jgi:8-hydroxy-5-deazaflavin:NADPH oxidoreductase
MKIGVLGAGNIGGTVGGLWIGAGHEVRFGTRHPAEVKGLVERLGAKASAGTPEETARFGDAVLLAVPLGAVPALGRAIANLVAGKLVLDASNAYRNRDGELADAATRHPQGSSGWVAAHLPGAHVIKGFNTVYFKVLLSEAHRGGGDRLGIPLAGDDSRSLATAEQLVRDAGFAPVVIGALGKGKQFEPDTPVYASGMPASEVARALGVAVA